MKFKFTKLAALLLAGAALLAAGCTDYEVDIQKVDKKVDELAVKTAADLAAQVDALKAMINTLEANYKAADQALKTEIRRSPTSRTRSWTRARSRLTRPKRPRRSSC